jgi:hypothetical protein
MKSTAVVEEPYTILDELTFDCLAFVAQQLRQRQDRLVVSRQTVRSCSLVARFFCKPVLNLNGLELAGFFCVAMMRPALEHGLFKAMSGFVMNTQAWCPKKIMHI